LPLLFSFMVIFTDGRTPCTSDHPVARPLPKHRTTHTHTKHPCIVWDSHPRSRLPGKRRQYMPYTARLPWPAQFEYAQYESKEDVPLSRLADLRGDASREHSLEGGLCKTSLSSKTCYSVAPT
jgi:hypothetical protein